MEPANTGQSAAAAGARRTSGSRPDARLDLRLVIVLLVWASCCLAFGTFLYHFLTPLPFCDEWELTSVATGDKPVTLSWVWKATNQHRLPLVRLEVLWLGWLTAWDLRLVHYVNLGFLVVGSLCLILAARAVRGRSALSDAFLALAVLNPWQYQTIVLYCWAFGMALGFMCMALSAMMTGWPLRSRPRLALFFVLALLVAFSGGPAGGIWSIGLCGMVLKGWLDQPRAWKRWALAGSAVVIAASGTMLLLTPHVAAHDVYRSDSIKTLLVATAKFAVGWLGLPPLEATWPWALVVLVVPIVYLLVRIGKEVGQLFRAGKASGADPSRWADLGVVLLATLAVALVIGYGRGRYPMPWDSRYMTLVIPIAVVTYLLLVRLRAPLVLPGVLAGVMAICVGWTWPEAITWVRSFQAPATQAATFFRLGQEPLSVLSVWYAHPMCWGAIPEDLLRHLLQLRRKQMSVFQNQPEAVPGMGCSQAWAAVSGRFTDGLRPVDDGHASEYRALQADRPGSAAYEMSVPADGCYLLCCRLSVPASGASLAVRVDDGPNLERSLPSQPGYYPYLLEQLLSLSAGTHTLTITLPQPGTRLDLLELVPRRASGRQPDVLRADVLRADVLQPANYPSPR
jgi:hypothetical protein